MKKLLYIILLPSIVFAQAGTSGAAFLKIGLSPRAGGMGEAFVAIADDAGGTYYNPAGLLLRQSPQIDLTHRAWIDDIQSQSLSACVPMGNIALGLNVTTTTVSNIEIRTRPGDSEGNFTSRDFVLGGSIAYRIAGDVTIGGTAKYVFEKIFVDEWSGLGFDFGIHYRTTVEGLALGVSFSNLGSMTGTNTPPINLPATLRAGAAYTLPIEFMRSDLTVAADVVQLTRDGIFHSHFGGEFVIDQTVALRLGYQTGYDFRNFTAGVGIRYRSFSLDYCILPMSQQAGTAQTIGLGLTL